MSSEEQRKIYQMVEDGKISPEEAMALLRALEQRPTGEHVEVSTTGAGQGTARSDAPEFEEVKARARRFAAIPLWTGVGLTLLSAYWLFALVQNSNYGFWFFCAWFPLFLGILLLTLSAGGMNSRWLYVDVHQEPGEWPQRITLGFPLPFGWVRWGLRNFGHYATGLDHGKLDAIAAALNAGDTMREPLIVHVDEGEGGERVQVYIG